MRAWHKTHAFALAYRFRGVCVFLLGSAGVAALWSEFTRGHRAWSLPVLLGGLGLRIWARGHIGLHSRGRRLEAPYLSVGGPYRFFPHPLYLANSLVALGLVGAGNPVLPSIAASLPIFLFYGFLGLGEGAYLKGAEMLERRAVVTSPGWSKEVWSLLPPLWAWLALALGFPARGLR